MSVTTWEPYYEMSGTISKVASGYVVTGLLDRWFLQSHVPVAETPLSHWLMDQVGYVPPPTPGGGGGSPQVTTGRIYPRR